MKPEEMTLEVGIGICCRLPRDLGVHPRDGRKVMASNGRFGPYVKCGEETRSLPAGMSPIDVTLRAGPGAVGPAEERAPRLSGAKGAAQGAGHLAGHQGRVQLLEGRYGPYVSDGVTNASLPKQQPIETTTLEQALALLAARRGRAKRSPRSAKEGCSQIGRRRSNGQETGGQKASRKKEAQTKSE